MTAHGTQSIDRAADLLARVVRAGTPPTFTELCAETGYARSTTSRLLAALERNHLLRRDADGAWEPGGLFEQYAAGADTQAQLARAAEPVMAQLGRLTGETINLGVALGRAVVQIAQVDSAYFLGSRDWVGVDLPAHTSALGKVLYAHAVIPLGDGPLERRTPHTLPTVGRLRAQCSAIRADGYASTVDELEVGLTGVAAPVLRHGSVVAALGLSGPSTRLADRVPEVGRLVARQAAILTSRLGRLPEEGAA
ncbi:IclR family transcriptional regulator [Agilicoccus flavus]|uniref:IclR family transcriptional regulator n=1 Tax=Agilicoccus flavus TaxID=2775968 RepID=UPI001CF6B6DB|nr:IclR family transcriptional regulator [Agilicoccus flavus]